MPRSVTLRVAFLAGWCVVLALAALYPSASAPAAPQAAASLPHDQHEGLTVSADPYTDAARAKEKFGKADPLPKGILPVEVFLHNETPQPIRINLNAIQLVVHYSGGRHDDLDWLDAKTIATTMLHPNGAATPHAPRLPVGKPGSGDSKTEKLAQVFDGLLLETDIVPPMDNIHGFLFFDLGGDLSLVQDSSLYVPEATILSSKRPLMFFEVFFGKASPR